MTTYQLHFAQVLERDQAGAQAVVDIVIVVGDLVGEIGQLRLETGLLAIHKALAHIAELTRLGQRAVLEDALAAFKAQVESGEIGVAFLEFVDHAQ